MNKIVIVEDDVNIREELKQLLCNSGYDAEYVSDYIGAADYIIRTEPELVLLDVNLPGISGLTICDMVRKSSEVPIIFVTSNRTSMDELNCIMRGGDDYISKPYQVPILLARIVAVLKRTLRGKSETNETIYSCGEVRLDIAAGTITHGEALVELTKNELKILYYMFKNKGRIIARTEIIDYLWDNDVYIDDNALSVNVTRIRGKLSEIGCENLIQTKRGLGYICD